MTTLTLYCSRCTSELSKAIFDCHTCETTFCPQCVGKARDLGGEYRDFLCPECEEVLYLRLDLTKCSPEEQLAAAQKNNPEFSMGAVHSPAENDARFHPNQRRRRDGVKRRQVNNEEKSTDDLDADVQRSSLRDREPDT